jgi:lipopolysaccharide/colanic/teichoic acid biosynthesis glycosyltransferase
MSRSFYVHIGKRLFDTACALLGLLLLLPFLAIIAILVRWSGGPIFFRQIRTGRYGTPFRVWKFRSMSVHKSGEGGLLTASGDVRVTPLGRWLRRTKIDELPQLFNVLAGEMSLVGPRPEVPRYTDKYTPEQRHVFSLRPGITGPASNAFISEEELLARQPDKEAYYLSVLLPAKLEGDLSYCRNLSFNKDLKLIANTFTSLLMKWSTDRDLVQDVPPKWF